jgi:hypothetical protein
VSRTLATTTLVVTDPHYKSRVLAVHDGLSRPDAAELRRIYLSLGFTKNCITVTPAPAEWDA